MTGGATRTMGIRGLDDFPSLARFRDTAFLATADGACARLIHPERTFSTGAHLAMRAVGPEVFGPDVKTQENDSKSVEGNYG